MSTPTITLSSVSWTPVELTTARYRIRDSVIDSNLMAWGQINPITSEYNWNGHTSLTCVLQVLIFKCDFKTGLYPVIIQYLHDNCLRKLTTVGSCYNLLWYSHYYCNIAYQIIISWSSSIIIHFWCTNFSSRHAITIISLSCLTMQYIVADDYLMYTINLSLTYVSTKSGKQDCYRKVVKYEKYSRKNLKLRDEWRNNNDKMLFNWTCLLG
jgi:hypothetical protein